MSEIRYCDVDIDRVCPPDCPLNKLGDSVDDFLEEQALELFLDDSGSSVDPEPDDFLRLQSDIAQDYCLLVENGTL